MKTIVTITGIRPDFIRMSEIFKKLDKNFNHILIHTGQHYDSLLSDVFFKDLDIRKPDYNLGIGAPGKTHYEQQADLTLKLPPLIKAINPDYIGFLGDSNSVLASIPLKKEGYKIFHIEAGMRSGDMRMPEEVNRIMCDHASNLRFVYHKNYVTKLKRENLGFSNVITGNTIVEPLQNILSKINTNSSEKYIILDIHRPENFLDLKRLKQIIDISVGYSQKYQLPLYMLRFGRTIKSIEDNNINLKGVEVVDLMGYVDFVKFMLQSKFLISDSGTAQEEPCLLGKKVLVPRDFTERPESYEHKCSYKMILSDDDNITDFYRNREFKFLESETIDCSWLYSRNMSTSDIIVNKLKKC